MDVEAGTDSGSHEQDHGHVDEYDWDDSSSWFEELPVGPRTHDDILIFLTMKDPALVELFAVQDV